MANNDEIVAEDVTFEEEMNNCYELEAADYNDNDDDTVEYLDLNLIVDSIPDMVEDHISHRVSAPTPKLKTSQPSVLKTRYSAANKPRNRHKLKAIGAKRSTGDSGTDPVENGYSLKNFASVNRTSRAERERNDDLASVSVHAAVDAINARLAESARSTNGPGRNNLSNDTTESHASSDNNLNSSSTVETDAKSNYDSLDLFFQSMAQTVLNLPSRVQAKIKMDICKVIAMAEIKYCSSENKISDINKI